MNIDLENVSWDSRRKTYGSHKIPNVRISIPSKSAKNTNVALRLNRGARELICGSRNNCSIMFGTKNHTLIIKRSQPEEPGTVPIERDKEFTMSASWIRAKLNITETSIADLEMVNSDIFTAEF